MRSQWSLLQARRALAMFSKARALGGPGALCPLVVRPALTCRCFAGSPFWFLPPRPFLHLWPWRNMRIACGTGCVRCRVFDGVFLKSFATLRAVGRKPMGFYMFLIQTRVPCGEWTSREVRQKVCPCGRFVPLQDVPSGVKHPNHVWLILECALAKPSM